MPIMRLPHIHVVESNICGTLSCLTPPQIAAVASEHIARVGELAKQVALKANMQDIMALLDTKASP